MEMNLKKVEIRLSGAEGFRREVLDSLKRPVFGRHVLFLEPRQFHSMFTVERLRLLKAIRDNPDFGTVKLANLLGRKQEAVSRDLSYLKAIGIVSDEPAKQPARPSAKPKPAAMRIVI